MYQDEQWFCACWNLLNGAAAEELISCVQLFARKQVTLTMTCDPSAQIAVKALALT